MKTMRYLDDVVTLSLNPDACVGCGMCLDVCPHGVLAMEGRKVRIVDRNGCMECGALRQKLPIERSGRDPGRGMRRVYHSSLVKRQRKCILRRTGVLLTADRLTTPVSRANPHLPSKRLKSIKALTIRQNIIICSYKHM